MQLIILEVCVNASCFFFFFTYSLSSQLNEGDSFICFCQQRGLCILYPYQSALDAQTEGKMQFVNIRVRLN